MKTEVTVSGTLRSELSVKINIEECLTAKALGYSPKKEDKLLILREINDLFTAFGIDKSERAIELLMYDITEKYPAESVEDIAYCLRKGRQGYYNEKIYGQNFNMQVLTSWMAQHLEEKYAKKERIISEAKKAMSSQWETRADYVEAARLGKVVSDILAKQKKQRDDFEHNYNDFKARYFTDKNKTITKY